jgi:uncharacterized protein with HEPN domain
VKGVTAYLRHILECIRRIEDDGGGGREKIMQFYTLQDAVLRNLQTMSESTQLLSEPLKSTHPEIEWKRVSAFRNLLVHNYLGIGLQKVWEIVQRDVPF